MRFFQQQVAKKRWPTDSTRRDQLQEHRCGVGELVPAAGPVGQPNTRSTFAISYGFQGLAAIPALIGGWPGSHIDNFYKLTCTSVRHAEPLRCRGWLIRAAAVRTAEGVLGPDGRPVPKRPALAQDRTCAGHTKEQPFTGALAARFDPRLGRHVRHLCEECPARAPCRWASVISCCRSGSLSLPT